MKINICNKCKGFNHKEIISYLNVHFENINYIIECNNMCGVGRNKIVIIKDDVPIIVEKKEELIKKINASN